MKLDKVLGARRRAISYPDPVRYASVKMLHLQAQRPSPHRRRLRLAQHPGRPRLFLPHQARRLDRTRHRVVNRYQHSASPASSLERQKANRYSGIKKCPKPMKTNAKANF
jgi:hypothetical protein